MATASERTVKNDFTRALSARPGHYSFYAAVRRIEQLSPSCPRIGSRGASLTPAVHFAQVPHLHFPPSELFDYTTTANSSAGTLQVYFFGFFGPNGALPLALTEHVHERSRHYYDLTMQRFADIFHDRLISLFYRAGTCSQAAVSYDRRDDDPLSTAAASLAGVPAAPEASPLPPHAPISHARELAEKNKARPLRRLLEQFFGLPVSICQHTPCYLPISEDARCLLGRAGTGELGRTSLLGDRQRSISDCITLHIGPISYGQYCRFLPGSTGYRRLQTWLRLMSSRPLSWQLHFLITSASIPAPALNASCQLGGNTLFASTTSTTSCTLTINF